MITTQRVTTPRSFWAHIGSPTNEDWRCVAYAAGYAADERSAPLRSVRDLEEELARVEAIDKTLGRHLRDAVNDVKTSIYDTALVLGVALARTWPDRLEDLDAWPDRAIALAQIPTDGESASPMPIAAAAPATAPSAAPPFEGETIADRPSAEAATARTSATVDAEWSDFPRGSLLWAFDKGGSQYDDWRGFVRIALRTIWERSETHRAFIAASDALIDALEPAAPELAGALDDLVLDHWVDAAGTCALLGYALGRTAEPGMERFDDWLERAQRLAFPNGMPERLWAMRRAGAAVAVHRGASTSAESLQPDPVAEPVRDAAAIDAWLADHALADAAPAEVIARLLADHDALERLRSVPS